MSCLSFSLGVMVRFRYLVILGFWVSLVWEFLDFAFPVGRFVGLVISWVGLCFAICRFGGLHLLRVE